MAPPIDTLDNQTQDALPAGWSLQKPKPSLKELKSEAAARKPAKDNKVKDTKLQIPDGYKLADVNVPKGYTLVNEQGDAPTSRLMKYLRALPPGVRISGYNSAGQPIFGPEGTASSGYWEALTNPVGAGGREQGIGGGALQVGGQAIKTAAAPLTDPLGTLTGLGESAISLVTPALKMTGLIPLAAQPADELDIGKQMVLGAQADIAKGGVPLALENQAGQLLGTIEGGRAIGGGWEGLKDWVKSKVPLPGGPAAPETPPAPAAPARPTPGPSTPLEETGLTPAITPAPTESGGQTPPPPEEAPSSYSTGGALQPQETASPEAQPSQQVVTLTQELEESLLDRVAKHTEAQTALDRVLAQVPDEEHPEILGAIDKDGEDAYARGDYKSAMEAAYHHTLLDHAIREFERMTPEERAARSQMARGEPGIAAAEIPPGQHPTEAVPAGYVAGIAAKVKKGKKKTPEGQAALPFTEPTPVGVSAAAPPEQLPAPAEAAPAPKAVAPPTASKPLWMMTRDELDAEHAAAKDRDHNDLVSLFGEAGAKKYERLQRQANSSVNTKRADAAAEEVAQMENQLAPEQQNLLYGIGDTRHSLEEVKGYRDALHGLDYGSPEDLAQSLQWAVSQVGDPTRPVESMSQAERIRFAQLQEAHRIAQQNGWDTQKIIKDAVAHGALRFSDPQDAQFMLEKIVRAIAPPAVAQDKKHRRTRRGEPAPEPQPVGYALDNLEKRPGESPYKISGEYQDVWRAYTSGGAMDFFAPKGIPKSEVEDLAAKIIGQNLRSGVPPERIFRTVGDPPAQQLPKPRTYEDVQKDIDDLENKLEDGGKTPRMFYFKGNEILAGTQSPSGITYEQMPPELESLYQERDAIGSGQLQQSIGEITYKLKAAGITDDKEIRRILEYYALDPRRTDAAKQYMAAEHTQAMVGQPIKRQIAQAYSALAAERGIFMDDQDDLFRDRKTTQDAVNAVKAVYTYFHGAEPGPEEFPKLMDLEPKRAAPTPVAPQVAGQRPRPNIILRETLPGAKEHAENKFKNAIELERAHSDLTAADQE
jgi:hypothetical protein